MAAKDYVFVTGWRDAYLAKKKKSNSPMMSIDRRIIKDNEILGLFEFYLRKYCSEHKKTGRRMLMSLLPLNSRKVASLF